MATVFLAQDLKHRRTVAIKDPEDRDRRRGRDISASCARSKSRPNSSIRTSCRSSTLALLAISCTTSCLTWKGGRCAHGSERETPLPLDEALRLAREIASALGHAHRQGFIHRDIKPENILLSDGMALVADFGIARLMSASDGETLTGSGTVMGTPLYMSPEQALGTGECRRTRGSL